jgi:hypothetical protein
MTIVDNTKTKNLEVLIATNQPELSSEDLQRRSQLVAEEASRVRKEMDEERDLQRRI